MSLIEQDLATIDSVLSAPPDEGDPGALLAELRRRLPGLVCMGCDASDVLEEPYRSYARVDLHLVDTRNHCTEMTLDPQRASGILLALRVTA